jgi:hypothetical protein
VPPLGPVNPALHVQAVRAWLASGELELAGHVRQVAADAAPNVVEYVPAPHERQVDADAAATVVEYVPAPQSVHATLPVLVLYLPATQAVHEPAGPVYPAPHSGGGGGGGGGHVSHQEKETPE